MLEKALQHNPAEVLLCLMLSVSLPFRDLDATSGPAPLLWWQQPELTLGFLCLLPSTWEGNGCEPTQGLPPAATQPAAAQALGRTAWARTAWPRAQSHPWFPLLMFYLKIQGPSPSNLLAALSGISNCDKPTFRPRAAERGTIYFNYTCLL